MLPLPPHIVTMKDVAKQAGVSTATVSRALTSPEKVSVTTRAKVEAAALAIGYSGSPHHYKTRSSAFFRVLVLIPDIVNSFFSEIIRGIETIARQQHCLIFIINGAVQDLEETEIAELIITSYYDGFLSLGTSVPRTTIVREAKNTFPLVRVNEFSCDFEHPAVHIDNLTAAFEAVSYLITTGHQQIACLTGPSHLPVCQYRRQGYIQALQRYNLPINPHYILRGDFSFTSGIEAFNYMLTSGPLPDAVFCHNDEMAMGILYQAQHSGIKIPHQLSVIGFDGLEKGQYCTPALTTVVQPLYRIGTEAITLLIELMKGKPMNKRSLLLETQLLIRQSTRPEAEKSRTS